VSNDHLDAHFRVIFDRLTASHRAALEELRDGNAALARAAAKGPLKPDGTRMSEPVKAASMKIVIERSPWPNAEPHYLWTAYYQGREDELSKAGHTPNEALTRLLIAEAQAEEGEGSD
jgi:hypothetical protein